MTIRRGIRSTRYEQSSDDGSDDAVDRPTHSKIAGHKAFEDAARKVWPVRGLEPVMRVEVSVPVTRLRHHSKSRVPVMATSSRQDHEATHVIVARVLDGERSSSTRTIFANSRVGGASSAGIPTVTTGAHGQ